MSLLRQVTVILCLHHDDEISQNSHPVFQRELTNEGTEWGHVTGSGTNQGTEEGVRWKDFEEFSLTSSAASSCDGSQNSLRGRLSLLWRG